MKIKHHNHTSRKPKNTHQYSLIVFILYIIIRLTVFLYIILQSFVFERRMELAHCVVTVSTVLGQRSHVSITLMESKLVYYQHFASGF